MKLSVIIVLASLLSFSVGTTAEELTDDQIRKLLIRQSILSYSGSCPCPYNTARNGSRCDGPSAYSKPGGASPLCYSRDVSDQMVERYRKRLKADDYGMKAGVQVLLAFFKRAFRPEIGRITIRLESSGR